MVQYRYLGYGVTDEKGIAKLDHDPQGRAIEHSYTGSGAGLVDIVASLDSEIGDGSLVSETFSIIDALLFDHCTSEISGRWYNYQSILSISYTENGMTITKDETNNTQRYLYYNDPTISTTKVGGYNSITTEPYPSIYNAATGLVVS